MCVFMGLVMGHRSECAKQKCSEEYSFRKGLEPQQNGMVQEGIFITEWFGTFLKCLL